jgi:ATP-dependent Lon protease
MPDNEENVAKLAQFVAQEIEIDGKIPHATKRAVELLINEARKRARVIDDQKDSLTLRLRDLGGVVRMAGDIAVMEGDPLIMEKHMNFAISNAISIEDQIIKRYNSFENALQRDVSSSQNMSNMKQGLPNENVDRSYM